MLQKRGGANIIQEIVLGDDNFVHKCICHSFAKFPAVVESRHIKYRNHSLYAHQI